MEKIKIEGTDVFVIVDVQNDFCSGGILSVRNTKSIIDIINKIQPLFNNIVLTRDWHPQNHKSFSENPLFKDGSWPVHCVQHTVGAEFHVDLDIRQDVTIINKGKSQDKEEYSGFQVGLMELLEGFSSNRIFVAGIATDFCVKNTVLDALEAGLEVFVISDAIRGVDNPKGSEKKAIEEMSALGAVFCESSMFSIND